MNMFKDSKATNKADYIAMLPDEKQKTIIELDKIIHQTVPELDEFFAYNMLGYGAFTYTNYKKEQVKWPVIALAAQKNYTSVYVCSMDGDEYIAEKYKDKLGKVSVGKSCIRFKKIEDLNMDILKKVLKIAAKSPGLNYASDREKA